MNKQRGSTLSALLIISLWVAAIGGWVANIVKLVGIIDGGITGMFVARIVGIFAVPLGAVLGFF